jgi:hypothetical protein
LVRLVVGANDAGATAHLEALKERLKAIGRQVETAHANVDDKQAQLTLERLAIKLDRVGRKTEGKVSIEGIARSIVELDALDLALDRVGRKVSGGARGGIIGGISGLFSGLSQSLGQLPGILGQIGSQGPVGAAALGAMAAAAAALVVSLGPLAVSLGLVAAGIAGFAAIAVPELTKVWSAVSKGGKALKALDPQERALAGPIRSLQAEFGKLQKAVQPEVLRAFASGLGILKSLMPALRPLIVAAGKAIDQFLGSIEKWLRSPSGQKFIKWLSTEGPMAMRAFGNAIWRLTRDFGSAMETIFKVGQAVDRTLVANWRMLQTAWVNAWHAIYQTFGAISGFFHSIASAVGSTVDWIVGKVGELTSALSSINGALGGIPGKVLGFLGFQAGGLTAAGGGVRNGLTLVGEHGPELLRLPPSTQVYNNGQTQAMLGGQGGQQQIVIEFHAHGNALSQEFFTQLAAGIRIRGGNPQIITRKAILT